MAFRGLVRIGDLPRPPAWQLRRRVGRSIVSSLIGLLRIAYTMQIRDLTIEQAGSAACGGLPRIPLHAGPHQVSDLEVAQGVLILDSLSLDVLLHHAAAAFARLPADGSVRL